MPLMDWDKLRVFHAVAEAGSFTRAGEALNLSQSAVSRQIGALEKTLAAPLFQRHARGLVLTEQGNLLYRTVHDIYAKLSSTQALLTETAARPQGPLRVSTTPGLGATWLTPRIKEFVELYPEISISLVLEDTEADLTIGEADVAIRMKPPTHPDLIQRHLMTVHFHVYASSGYVRNYGRPENAGELKSHRLIAYTNPASAPVQDVNWLLEAGTEKGRKHTPVFQVNSVYGMFRAVQSDLGIAALPDYMATSEPSLIRILPELEGRSIDAFFVYPETQRRSKRVAVFRDFLVRQISTTAF